jgi:hypothetical protein
MLKAWVLFNLDGKPEFIDSDLTEEAFKNWYLKYLDQGWKAKFCEINPILDAR